MKKDKINRIINHFSTVIMQPMLHEIYLCSDIEEPAKYIEEFNLIRNASEFDTIRIALNTHGGNSATAIQFVRVISESKAHVITSIEGNCSSAGTIIFLAGDEFEISSNSTFMIHNYTGGIWGKGHEMQAMMSFSSQWARELITSSYEEFLTKDEIEFVLAGGDLYFTSTQVGERGSKLLKYRKELAELEAEENATMDIYS